MHIHCIWPRIRPSSYSVSWKISTVWFMNEWEAKIVYMYINMYILNWNTFNICDVFMILLQCTFHTMFPGSNKKILILLSWLYSGHSVLNTVTLLYIYCIYTYLRHTALITGLGHANYSPLVLSQWWLVIGLVCPSGPISQ